MPTVRQVVVRGNLSRGGRPYLVYLCRRFFGDCLTQDLGGRVLIRVTENSLNAIEVLRLDGTVVGKAITKDPVASYPRHFKEIKINPTASVAILEILKHRKLE